MLRRAFFAPPACRLRSRDSLVADFFMMHRLSSTNDSRPWCRTRHPVDGSVPG
jgi:hypothetical protein